MVWFNLVHLLLSLVVVGAMGAYLRKTTTTAKPRPITLSPLELELVLADDVAFKEFQQQRYWANPHWFKQPGRPCNASLSLNHLYFTNRSALPKDEDLMAVSRNYCAGSTSPTASIDLVSCRPESGTCDCFVKTATWDAKNRICRMLPGAFCILLNETYIPCVHGARCVNEECVCDKGQECLDHKVPAPDPGPPGDPSARIVPLPTKEPLTLATTTKDPTYL